MVRFADTTNVINGGRNSNGDDNNSKNSSIGGGEGIKRRGDASAVVGKKRLPLTPHPASLNGNKKRSPGNGDTGNNGGNDNDIDIDAQTNACIASQEIESVSKKQLSARMITRDQIYSWPFKKNGDITSFIVHAP